jgi:predicted metal-dependent peptidase
MATVSENVSALAQKIWRFSLDRLLINFRFLDVALSGLKLKERIGADCVSCDISTPDKSTIYYDPTVIIRLYKKNPNNIIRLHLHILLHCIYSHSYKYNKVEKDLWDLAADMAVENTALSLGLSGYETKGYETLRDDERKSVLSEWKEKVGNLTADRIYRKLREDRLGISELLELSLLFKRDEHENWAETEVLEVSEAQWKKISERIKAELKSFSEDKTDDKSLLQNLEEATKEKYDYGDFLRKFSVSGEDMQINDDEFDYVYYTYGLSLYGNLPLVEPLEYKDINKIKEFVVAIDTSGSCRGEIVQAFLNKTYGILKSSENFFRKVNIHIIQCDSQIRQDVKITNDDEFEAFMHGGKLEGFGSTDFRPVFEYVNKAIEDGEFENLKGLIYFTDGYGVFPEKKPPYNYDTAFVFLEDDFEKPPVPAWAIKLILPVEDIESFEDEREKQQ